MLEDLPESWTYKYTHTHTNTHTATHPHTHAHTLLQAPAVVTRHKGL